MKKKVEFLILGQGFAGTALALWLEKNQVPYHIISSPELPGASRAAVGLVNPVTGRRLAKTWNMDLIFPLANFFYRMAWKILHPDEPIGSYFEPLPIWKALHSVEEINFLSGKSGWDGYGQLLEIDGQFDAANDIIFSNTVGWCKIKQGGRIRVKEYLDDSFTFFQQNGLWSNYSFEKVLLKKTAEGFEYKEISAKNVVSALGLDCPWVKKDLIPVKGQVLVLKGLPNFDQKVLKTEKFFLPDGAERFLAGSTYEHDFSHPDPDLQGQKEILRDLKAEIKKRIEITETWAGIRPTTATREPIIRQIEPGLFSLNGMGTKGASLSPWAAWQLLGLSLSSQH